MYPFRYTRAGGVAEAVRLHAERSRVGETTAAVRYLAGGTTLYDLMKLGVERPRELIDVRALPELAGYRLTDDELVIGAGVSMAEPAADPAIRRAFPALTRSLLLAASAQLRNMATIGGNLVQRTRCPYFRSRSAGPCNKREPGSGCSARRGADHGQAVLGGSEHCIAAYPGDLAVALVALDAVVEVVGPRGARSLPVAALHRAPGATPETENDLAAGELITAVRVPVSPTARRSTFWKVRPRESYAFAWASAAVAVDTVGTGPTGAPLVGDCRIVLGGLATRPWQASAARRWLTGRELTADTARQAGTIAVADAVAGRHNGFKIELGARTVAAALTDLIEPPDREAS